MNRTQIQPVKTITLLALVVLLIGATVCEEWDRKAEASAEYYRKGKWIENKDGMHKLVLPLTR